MITRRALAIASAVGRDLTILTLTLGPPKVPPAAQVGIECRGREFVDEFGLGAGSIHNMMQMKTRVQSVGWLSVSPRLLDDDRHDNRCRREFRVGAAYGGAGGAGL